jgi:hypothetical protein
LNSVEDAFGSDVDYAMLITHLWTLEEVAALLDANVKPRRGPYEKSA